MGRSVSGTQTPILETIIKKLNEDGEYSIQASRRINDKTDMLSHRSICDYRIEAFCVDNEGEKRDQVELGSVIVFNNKILKVFVPFMLCNEYKLDPNALEADLNFYIRTIL